MPSLALFKIRRPDGRSNQQVVIDEVGDAEPGKLFTFDDIKGILDHIGNEFDRRRIGGVVRQANLRLLKEFKRELISVRDLGYKVAEAREHVRLASARERSADRQIARGLRTLQHVRFEELTENERTMHVGHLMITQGLHSNMRALVDRQSKQDAMLSELVKRVETLEIN